MKTWLIHQSSIEQDQQFASSDKLGFRNSVTAPRENVSCVGYLMQDQGIPAVDQVPLDDADVQLVNLVQEDSAASAESMGRLLGLSAHSVRRRVQRLKQLGVIVRETAVVHPHFRAARVRALLIVTLAAEMPDPDRESFCRRVAAAPEVSYCSLARAPLTVVLLTMTRNVELLHSFVQGRLKAEGPVLDVTSILLSNEVKNTAKVILDRADQHHWVM